MGDGESTPAVSTSAAATPDRCPICGAETVPSAAFAGVRRCDRCRWIGVPRG
jgi:ribosomal protein L37AE/L43A